jgi:hypothetical protein
VARGRYRVNVMRRFGKRKRSRSAADDPSQYVGHVWSFVPPNPALEGGLPGETVVGYWEPPWHGNPNSPVGFHENPQFVDLMHKVIGQVGENDPEMRATAESQGTGYLYIIDLRTPDGPQGNVPVRDIVGLFQIRDGDIVRGSYQPTGQHRLLTEDGPFLLPPRLQEAVIEEVIRRATEHVRDGQGDEVERPYPSAT